MQIVPTVTCPSTSPVDPMAFLSETLCHFIPFAKPCLARAVRFSMTTPWRDCSSLTLGEACGVACADGHTAAGDIEITMTCVFDPGPTNILLDDSAHSCKWVSCDLSTLAPSCTVNHDGPKTVFGKSWVANDSHAISGTAAFTVWLAVSISLVKHCRASLVLTCSTALYLDETALLGPRVKVTP